MTFFRPAFIEAKDDELQKRFNKLPVEWRRWVNYQLYMNITERVREKHMEYNRYKRWWQFPKRTIFPMDYVKPPKAPFELSGAKEAMNLVSEQLANFDRYQKLIDTGAMEGME